MKKHTTNGITVKSLLNLLPTHLLEEKARETEVNKHVKKLSGEVMFQLLLMGVLNSDRSSLRMMADLYKKRVFQLYASIEKGSSTKHTSLSDRLKTINVSFFEQMFEASYEQLSKHFPAPLIKKKLVLRYDSTSISASAKLLESGMFNGLTNKKSGEHHFWQIKATIGFDGLYPRSVKMYNEQAYLSEDRALGKAIKEQAYTKDSVIVFDRGLQKRATFAEFSKAGKAFITRINPTKGYRVIKDLNPVRGIKTERLSFISDQQVYLDTDKNKIPFRLIKAKNKDTQEELFFLTTIFDLPAQDIALIYKSRWDIEVFFRFLKQELNLKHFISYSNNGIQVMLYVILIAAMLIMIYKKLNNIDTYKSAKIQFMDGLNTEITRIIVIMCGGDPNRTSYLDHT
jgi:transposase